jgi:hypothetical protein
MSRIRFAFPSFPCEKSAGGKGGKWRQFEIAGRGDLAGLEFCESKLIGYRRQAIRAITLFLVQANPSNNLQMSLPGRPEKSLVVTFVYLMAFV